MGSLAPFLPPHLVRRLATSGPPPRLPHVERFPAALLFSDISGFTALTERLQVRGREGAEEIAETINSAFAPAIRVIERSGGSIVSFGGDALFAIFTGGCSVRRAHSAAETIREAFAKRGAVTTSAGPVNLGIAQAVHYGEVEGLHLGTASRCHYLVVGRGVTALARLEAKASGGKVVLSPGARKRFTHERSVRLPGPEHARPTATVLRPYLEPRLLPLLGKFEGEYRRVAVLFLETRQARPNTIQSFYLALVESLDRTGGVLLKTDLSPAGTKWVGVFGIPQVHEEDPDRAARAAIDVVERAPRSLGVRGGLHTGVVANIVVGTRSCRSFDVMGDVVNTAARALGQARWGEVLVTEETKVLLAGVATRSRGKRAVKGKATALKLHALTAARAAVKQIRVSAPMTGRDAELAQIVEALERAKVGQGSVIGVKGDPGIGKSRLKYEAAKVAHKMGFQVHEGRAMSFGGMAYGTIGALLKNALGLPELPSAQNVLRHVSAASERLAMAPVDRHHVADVLGARYPDSPIAHLQPKDVRLNAMIAIRALLRALAQDTPRLFVLEDMHWADGASVESVEWLAKTAGGTRYVLLLLHRPGYEPPEGATTVELADLAVDAVGALLEAHLGEVPEKVRKLVNERAGGNPFYIEELARHLIESGVFGPSDEGYRLLRDPGAEDLPANIESLIAARLDRLTPRGKKVAQHAAVIGRTFYLKLLTNLPDVSRHATPGLHELSARELVFLRAAAPLCEYIFKHALTRDVAYASTLAARRRQIHRVVADAIEEVLGTDGFEAMLGHHRESAGEIAKARACYLAAARKATASFAHQEAARLYRCYLPLVQEPTAESVKARILFGAKVLDGQGLPAQAEAVAVLRQGLVEARSLGDRALEGSCLRSLGIIEKTVGRMEEAKTLFERGLELARVAPNRELEGDLLTSLADLHRAQGRMKEARALHETALGIARDVGDRAGEGHVLINLAILHEEQGRADEARALHEEALAIQIETGDRRLEAVVTGKLGNLCLMEGRLEEARVLYEKALAVHREVGNRRFEAEVLGNLAILHHEQGQLTRARSLYEQALALHRQVGGRWAEGQVLGNLAILDREQGRMEDARSLLEQALVVQREVGDRKSEGIFLANLGSLHFQQGRRDEAMSISEQALAILREVGARRFEGHALCHLGTMHVAAGRIDQARSLLDQALAVNREIDDRRGEAMALANLADLERLVGEEPERAERLARQSEALFAGLHDSIELAKVHCILGHLELARGRSAAEHLEHARLQAADLEAGPKSEVVSAIERLARAQEAMACGRTLVCGVCAEEHTEGQRSWLRVHRPTTIPADVMVRLNEDGTLRPEEATEPTTPAAEL